MPELLRAGPGRGPSAVRSWVHCRGSVLCAGRSSGRRGEPAPGLDVELAPVCACSSCAAWSPNRSSPPNQPSSSPCAAVAAAIARSTKTAPPINCRCRLRRWFRVFTRTWGWIGGARERGMGRGFQGSEGHAGTSRRLGRMGFAGGGAWAAAGLIHMRVFSTAPQSPMRLPPLSFVPRPVGRRDPDHVHARPEMATESEVELAARSSGTLPADMPAVEPFEVAAHCEPCAVLGGDFLRLPL